MRHFTEGNDAAWGLKNASCCRGANSDRPRPRARELNDKSVCQSPRPSSMHVRVGVGRGLDGPAGLPRGCIIRSNLARVFPQRWWKEEAGNPR